MECWNKKCKYKGKPEWGNFPTKWGWVVHVRCPKCESTEKVCLTGLDGLEYEIRYPSFCNGSSVSRKHPTVRKVIMMHRTGYSITCPICQYGMATGGGELDPREAERLKNMYAESLSKDIPKVI